MGKSEQFLFAGEDEVPVNLVLARHHLLQLPMYSRYAPQSAHDRRQCIIEELGRAEEALRARRAGPDVERQRLEILRTRQALEPLTA